MDLLYKGKPYKSDLSIRELSYELGISKTTLSRHLKNSPNHRNSYFEMDDNDIIYQYFWGEIVKTYDCLFAMEEEFNITTRTCLNRLKHKELWFHKYFSVEVEDDK